MSRASGNDVETESLTPIHWFALLLVLLTGVIHVYAGVVEGRVPVSLAGVGFLGAAVLFLLDYRRSLLYPVGIRYTAVQFPLWYGLKAGEFTTWDTSTRSSRPSSFSSSPPSSGRTGRLPSGIGR